MAWQVHQNPYIVHYVWGQESILLREVDIVDLEAEAIVTNLSQIHQVGQEAEEEVIEVEVDLVNQDRLSVCYAQILVNLQLLVILLGNAYALVTLCRLGRD